MVKKLKETIFQSVKNLENRIFIWVLFVAGFFLGYSSMYGFLVDSPIYYVIQDAFLSLLCFWLYQKVKFSKDKNYLIRTIFCSVAHVFFHINWINWAGFEGHMSYIYYVLCILTIAVLSIRVSSIILTLSLLVHVGLFYAQYNDIIIAKSEVTVATKVITFFIMCSALAFIVSTTKSMFDKQNYILKKANLELEEVNKSLENQNQQLIHNKNVIYSFNSNLQEMVDERMEELSYKGKQLEEMAFINAHLLRSPLARILGLLHIMELEQDKSVGTDEKLKIKQLAKLADNIVGEINKVTN